MKNFPVIILIFASLIFSQVERDPLFDEVETYLDILKSSSADVICPTDYAMAIEHYEEARIMSNENDSFRDIREELENSIYYITEINDVIDVRSQIFSEVLDARQKAIEQNADKYASSDWIEGEELLLEAAEYADYNEIAEARDLFPQIISYYNRAAANAEHANNLLYDWPPLQDANSELANLLSPQAYNEGMESLNDGLDNLSEGDDKEDLDEYLEEAESSLMQSARNAANFAERYPGILEERSDAKVAGAENHALSFWSIAETKLSSLGEMYEDGDHEDILDERPEAEDLYTLAKLEAVKNRILGPAKEKIETAYEQDADDLAPITLEKSEILYSEGIVLVDSDDYTEEEIQKAADESLAQANLAIRITQIIKNADDDNPTWEKQLLSWNTLSLESALSVPPKKIPVQPLSYNNSSNSDDDKLSEYYDDVAEIFNSNEAEVKESDGMIVISLIGLNFLPTQTSLTNDNKYLIDKTIAAIELFPNAYVTIVGHTDNASTKRFNKALSERVAQNVAVYITNNSNMSSTHIKYEGHGEEEPIANNKTYEGRMRNRRVDVIID